MAESGQAHGSRTGGAPRNRRIRQERGGGARAIRPFWRAPDDQVHPSTKGPAFWNRASRFGTESRLTHDRRYVPLGVPLGGAAKCTIFPYVPVRFPVKDERQWAILG